MRYMEPSPEQERHWKIWLADRPEHVRRVVECFDPWSLYKLGDKRVTLYGFNEGEGNVVTVQVNVLAKFNAVLMERRVFGINPNDLTPCDPPGPNEVVGLLLSEVEQLVYINGMRANNNLPPLAALTRDHDEGCSYCAEEASNPKA